MENGSFDENNLERTKSRKRRMSNADTNDQIPGGILFLGVAYLLKLG